MNKNVGGLDRSGRIVVGIIAVVAGVAAFAGSLAVGAVIGAVALLVGAILLVTGTTQRCPINQAAGIDTTK
ncbi:hypothetical protein L593_07705 [Salinarchaeum sp. Harcht-Bsk1]|uniref:YgaP family membrane protein n=1 Tax=Salinarchaeum sp. Harcht-Bsk1 TaxID=1333523 RepID=UPI0003422821|nr:DUF2892 domain-containing protein [Salinarchaeum sp. Harcht-Bsk1]AGN01486.1 hypothetical protein L593_07705 [Salinarchaeum sp. Harcht-Bsk1]